MIESISSTAETTKKKIWGPWATAGLGLVVGFVFFITQSLMVIPFAIAKFFKDANIDVSQLTTQLLNDGDLVSAATIASAIVCVGLVLIMIKVRHGETIVEYLGLKPITKKTIMFMLAITVGFVIVSSTPNYFLRKPSDSDFMTSIYDNATIPTLFWMAMVVFAPVFEETFLRGFLFVGFRHSKLGPIGATILTALIWAPLHIQYGVFQIMFIFFLGIILGIVRHKTDSLWSPLIIHTFNNLLAMVMVSLQ